MSEEERYVIEFQPKPKTKPGEWLSTGQIFKSKAVAEEEAEKKKKELGVPTRVRLETPLHEEWNFRKLMARMEGTIPALREMKKRGEAGAIAGWAIYKRYIESVLRSAMKPEASDEAFRITMISDLEAVGETELVEQLEGLHRKYPKGIPISEQADIIEDWNDSLQRRVGRPIPKDPRELTGEDIEESKRITRDLYLSKKPSTPKEKKKELSDLEKMKKQLDDRIEKLKKK